jgi:uncharacterized membrane protein (GlpM family)
LRYLLYFVIGGGLVSAIAYLGGVGRTLLASFVAMLPALTVLGFLFVHIEGGPLAARDYARGLLVFLPGWVAYVLVMWFGVLRLGLWGALGAGFLLFFLVNLAVLWLAGR